MRQFSATDAALAGFRFVRANPQTVAVWAAITLATSILAGLIAVPLAGPAMMQLQALGPRGSDNPEESLALLRQLAPLYGLALAYGCVFYPVLYAAVTRAVLRPAQNRHAYLRLGGDELRQFLLFLLTLAVGIGVYIALVLVVVVVAVAATLALGKGGLAGVLVGLASLAGVGTMVFLWVRLSLASPLTFDRGRVNLFGSWTLTRGRFWKMFACYLLVLLLIALIGLLVMVITVAVAMVGGGLSALRDLTKPDMTSLGAYFTPVRLVLTVIWAAAAALIWPVALMPAREVYAQLTADDAPAG